jgi:hypothetical protein
MAIFHMAGHIEDSVPVLKKKSPPGIIESGGV